MHIALALAGLAGAFGYWFFILRRAGDAAAELADAAGRARGAIRRRRFRRRAEASPIDAINDPRAAATVVAMAIAGGGGDLTDAQETVLRDGMSRIMGVGDPTEFMVFARWALDGARDANNVTMRLARLLTAALTAPERRDLMRLVRDVAAADGPLDPARISELRLLESRLGLAA